MMMNIAGYDTLQENILEEDDDIGYTFQYSFLSMADQKSKADYKATISHKQPIKHRTKESYVSQSIVPTPIEHLVFEEDKYPSDHFGLFDATLGIISLVVLFILFW